MSDRDLLVATARELFADAHKSHSREVEKASLTSELWSTLEELGFTRIGVPEELNGSGGSFADAAAVVHTAAYYAAPVPLAETLLATTVLGSAGMPPPSGMLTVAFASDGGVVHSNRITGTFARVPWASLAAGVVVVDESNGVLAIADPKEAEIRGGESAAGEPRDDLTFRDATPAWSGPLQESAWSAGAVLRAAQIAGALTRVLELTLEYTAQREQFGRPVAAFQAVQQQLAGIAATTVAIGVAVDAAAALEPGSQRNRAAAAAKAYASETCGKAALAAHQLHGAIGFTREHQLQLFTRRIWSWRDEFGNEDDWGTRLARALVARGADGAWEVFTGDEL